MATCWDLPGQQLVDIKGAVEQVLGLKVTVRVRADKDQIEIVPKRD